MGASLSASTVKSWFQYRCERKTRYDMMTSAERADAVIVKQESGAAWALEGDAFERRVLAHFAETQPLLAPPAGQDRLGEAETINFLKGQSPQSAATQVGLGGGPALQSLLGLPPGLKINRSYADLVIREASAAGTIFRIVDIKATRRSTPFHKAQVAFYARLLQGMLSDLGVDATVDPFGEVWHIRDGTRIVEGLHAPARFALRPYLRLVDEFLKRDAPRIAARTVRQGLDETFFHVYFKCEQCDYLGHCRTAIERSDPAANDLSAIPGVSHESKRALQARNLRSVGDVAARAGFDGQGPTSWSLQRRSEALIARARAQIAQAPQLIPNVLTYLMPPKVDRGFYLLADQDAVEDNLVTLGYLRRGGAPRSFVRVIERSDPAAERDALVEIFSALLDDLGEVDAHNRAADPAQQLQAHIFIYEPAEARTIQAAIGRHLDDPQVRAGLLHAVRLFPPDDVVPEPEFRGAHHLPATALRSVIEQLYALPCTVSYDLRQVSERLSAAGRISRPYSPDTRFRRDFSSLLGMEVIRALRDGRRDAVHATDVAADVRNRLEATADLAEWLIRESAAAAAPFLRLDKQPFQFQSTLDPLNAVDLDLLHAYELLESRSALLETLVRLAQPVRVRQQRGECLANLTLIGEGQHPNRRRWLRFSIPPASRDAEVSPDDLAIILTDDDPDLRLNPGLWPALRIRFSYGDDATLFVTMPPSQYNDPLVATLRRRTPPGGWCIDKAHRDLNGPRVQSFLQQLGQASA